MPYNTDLEEKIGDIVHQWDTLERKKMFGDICCLINGNMCFGVWKDYLIIKMVPELAAEKLNTEHVRQFDITGKPMKGWVMVEKGSWNKRDELINWLDIGRSFPLTLPKKSLKRKSLKRYTIGINDKAKEKI